MAKLFGFDFKQPDTSGQQAIQRRQERRLAQQENEEQREIGARRRLLNARAGGNSATLFGAPAGVAPTLGG